MGLIALGRSRVMVDPISIFLSLTREDLTRQAFRFLFFGEGETGLLVYAILLRYWGSTAEDDCGRGFTSCRTERWRRHGGTPTTGGGSVVRVGPRTGARESRREDNCANARQRVLL
jgi:hypothetical protein